MVTTAAVVLLFVLAPPAAADSAQARSRDEAAIRELVAAQAEAWNRSDAAAWSKGFVPDAELINIAGTVFKGRAELEARHAFVFGPLFKGSRTEVTPCGNPNTRRGEKDESLHAPPCEAGTMERFVEVAEGVSLWVESRGPEDAPAILLIMGSTVSGLVWPDELVEVLAREHRVIRYDHRDTGASTWAFDTVPYSATRMAEDALAILDALGLQRAHVVGLSLGGLLVQWLLVAHPERLLSATVIGAPALEGAPARAHLAARAPIDPGLYAFWRHMFEPREREAQIEWRVENWRRLNGAVIPFDAEEFRALERRIIAHAGRHDTSTAHARADPSGLARGAELAQVTVPTLVIATPEDPTNPESNSRFLAETLPRSTLVKIDGMGHTIPRAVVPPLAAALLSHIETVGRR